jgi:hypothetical protein
MNTFIRELRRITGVSKQYAIAAFYTLHRSEQTDYVQAAQYYAKRFHLTLPGTC